MQIHELKKPATRRRAKLIGRGGKRGTTAGRGTKGQKARAGHKIRPNIKDDIMRLPKKRGYKVSGVRQTLKPVGINLSTLEKKWPDQEITVTPANLVVNKFTTQTKIKKGGVKILGVGELTRALKVSGCQVSKSAAEKIEAAGGSVSVN